MARQQALQQADIKAGERVQVLSDGMWYDCDVMDVGDGAITAKYDDGDDEEEDIDIATRVRAVPEPLKLSKGMRMQVLFEGEWYDCDILEVSEDGTTCTARYDDGGDEECDVEIQSRIRMPRIKLSDLSVGQKMLGTVTGTPSFGAFMDVGAEREGLVHISRMAREHIPSVEEWVMMGQEIDVWVSSVEDEKLGLTMIEGAYGGGLKRVEDLTPFADLPSDEWFDGVVSRVAPYGAFVTVTLPGGESADGLVHISRMSDGYINSVEDEVSEGQDVKVRVVDVNMDDNRISLSMRGGGGSAEGGGGGMRAAPVDLTPFQDVSEEEWLTGKVARLAPFGAFVEVTAPGTDVTAPGLVHISRIRDGFIESVEDELEVGQEVQVRVDSVDVDGNKLGLSMLEGGGSAEGEGGGMRAAPVDLTPFQDVSEEEWLTGKVARLAPFGAFVEVTAPGTDVTATGLVHITRIGDGFIESVEDELEVDQEVQVRVDSVDVDGSKLGLSMKSLDAGSD